VAYAAHAPEKTIGPRMSTFGNSPSLTSARTPDNVRYRQGHDEVAAVAARGQLQPRILLRTQLAGLHLARLVEKTVDFSFDGSVTDPSLPAHAD
jgi:hypothetical protein